MFGIFGTPNTWISIHALHEESDFFRSIVPYV